MMVVSKFNTLSLIQHKARLECSTGCGPRRLFLNDSFAAKQVPLLILLRLSVAECPHDLLFQVIFGDFVTGG